MLRKLHKYWYLFWKFRELAGMHLLEYRADFWFWTGISVMWTVFNYFFFGLILHVSGGIGSWSQWEVYLFLSVFTIIDSFTWSVMYVNMWHYTNSVFTGKLSHLLLKPVDLQFLLMTQKNSYNNVPRFLLGVVGIVYSLKQLNLSLNLGDILLASLALFGGMMIIYNLWFMMATVSFWVERLNNINDIVPGFRRIWQFPQEAYLHAGPVVSGLLVPITIVTTIPSEVLLGRAHISSWVLLIFLTGATTWMARLLLSYSVARYSATGDG